LTEAYTHTISKTKISVATNSASEASKNLFDPTFGHWGDKIQR